jgi:hypothetical protein
MLVDQWEILTGNYLVVKMALNWVDNWARHLASNLAMLMVVQ